MKTKMISVMLALFFIMSIPAVFAQEETGSDEALLDEDSETEIEEYEEESVEDDTAELEALEEETPVETEELAEEVDLSEEDLEEYEDAVEAVGEKQYIYNKQLQHRLVVAKHTANAIIKHLEKKGEDVSELTAIQEEIAGIEESLDPETTTEEEFTKKVSQIKELTNQFKSIASGRVTKEEVAEEVAEELEENSEEIEEVAEEKVRSLFNNKQANKAMKKVIEEAKEMNKNGEKLLEVKERLTKLKQLQEQFLGNSATKENVETFREQWQNQLTEYKQEKLESKVKNERAKMLIDAKGVKEAIVEAEEAGEDTTELEEKLETITSEVKGLDASKIKSEDEIKAKANIVKNKLSNMKEDSKIKERIKVTAKEGTASAKVSGSSVKVKAGSEDEEEEVSLEVKGNSLDVYAGGKKK